MNVIELAREAGFSVKNFKPPVITAQHSNGSWIGIDDELEAFATLVRAAALEAAAVVCDAEAMRCEAAAQRAIEDGEHDEVSAIRSTAWKIGVCAAAIRQLKETK